MNKDEEFAYKMALDNEYLTTREEFEMYRRAILAAIEWGKKVDMENKKRYDKGIFNNS